MVDAAGLREEFRRRFGAEPLLARAPGRVNLIGEHTDYNDGFVMPAAIEFATWAAVAPRHDLRLVAESLQYDQRFDAALDTQRKRARDWTDYCWGVAASLREEGVELRGANLLVSGDVPIGAGVSSSAALEVAAGFALCQASGVEIEPTRLAQVCQRAENKYVGARCGIMDQFIACQAREGHALLLDCRSLEFRHAPLPAGVALVICNTMVKHSIAGGARSPSRAATEGVSEYNRRRAECEEGVRLLGRNLPGIRAMRDVTLAQLEQYANELPPVIRKRCRHVISENARVEQAYAALEACELERFGELMYASHASLRDDYEVSCAELDLMVELARAQKGVIGARMTGGGFGGCTINLVREEAVDEFRAHVARAYRERTAIEPEVYISRAAGGVMRIPAASRL